MKQIEKINIGEQKVIFIKDVNGNMHYALDASAGKELAEKLNEIIDCLNKQILEKE